MIGQRLLHYEITAKLGEGGMGEVYRAQDSRLDREVAIKVLPATVSENSEFRARFEREARTISSLNHPNICTLFDVGDEDGRHFLVMELIEGDSLAERLKSGPLPLDQVMRYGAQIAEALDEAHRKGIVHRDLKPANVMLTKSGAKLLDFGLARSGAESAPVQGLTEMPTEAQPLTAEGTILGTFQYMAPEQLEGLEADARTDIFALGALLYEMATGGRAFQGETRTSLIAAIVSAQPQPISTVTPMTPPALDHVVRRCLEKHPDDRWQNARDIASELRWVAEAGSQAGVPATVVSTRQQRRRLLGVAAATGWAVGIAALVWFALGTRGGPKDAEVFRAELVEALEAPYQFVSQGTMKLSPTGDRLAYHSAGGLAVRDLATGETEVLDGTEGASFPFWSPDSAWLAFFANQQLKKIASGGGPAQILAPAPAGRGGSWSPEGTIVFAPDITSALMRVSANGGTPTPTTVTEPGVTHRNPSFLPDGRRFLFTQRAAFADLEGSLAVGSLDGDPPTLLMERTSNAQWVGGFLFFVRDRVLTAQRFDLGRLEATGPVLPIDDAIDYYNPRDIAEFSVSEGGVLVYRQARIPETRLGWLDRDGRLTDMITEPAKVVSLRALNADASIAAVERMNDSGLSADIWNVDLVSGQPTRVTFDEVVTANITAALSSSGDRIAVSAPRDTGRHAVWLQSAFQRGEEEILLEETPFTVLDWSNDDRYLVGTVQLPTTQHDVAYIDLSQTTEIVPIIATEFSEGAPALSPDGRWLAYHSDETGSNEVYVVDFPAAERKWQVSRSGGFDPAWNSDGSGLVYFGNGHVYEALLQDDALRPIGAPQLLLRGGTGDDIMGLDLLPVGDRFLVLRRTTVPRPEPLRVIRNWQRLLE